MKNAIAKAKTRATEFVNDHKTVITVTVTATATFVATAAAARWVTKEYRDTVDEFVAEHGLTEKFNELFYDPTEDVPAL